MEKLKYYIMDKNHKLKEKQMTVPSKSREMLKQSKIIVTVRGGIPNVFLSSDLVGNTCQLTVIDYDDLERGEKVTEDQKIAEGEIENKQVVNVY